MSWIDTMCHYYVGDFNGLPLYLPYKTEWTAKVQLDDSDKVYEPGTVILIGGGSGEHPALAISDFDWCVLSCIGDIFDEDEDYKSKSFEKFEALQSKYRNDHGYKYMNQIVFDSRDWDVVHWVGFVKNSPYFGDVINHECHIEYKIQEEIGRWLILHAQELISPELLEFGAMVNNHRPKYRPMFERKPPTYGYGIRKERDPVTKQTEVFWHNPYPYKDAYTEE